MNQAENSWWRNQMENRNNLWKVFESTINILQALGEDMRPLGPTTNIQTCCRREKWFSENNTAQDKEFPFKQYVGNVDTFAAKVVFQSPTRHQSSLELALGFCSLASWVLCISTVSNKCMARERQGIALKY